MPGHERRKRFEGKKRLKKVRPKLVGARKKLNQLRSRPGLLLEKRLNKMTHQKSGKRRQIDERKRPGDWRRRLTEWLRKLINAKKRQGQEQEKPDSEKKKPRERH